MKKTLLIFTNVLLVLATGWTQTRAEWPVNLLALDCNRTAVPFVANEADTTYNPASPSLYALLLNTARASVNITDSAALASVEYAFAHNAPMNVVAFVAGVSIAKNGQPCISIANDTATVNAVFWFRWDKNWCVYLRTGCRNPCFVWDPFKDMTPKGGVPDCKPDTCVITEYHNNYKEIRDTIHDTLQQKLNLRPFVEQDLTIEIGKFSYTNGRYDLPTYVGLWLTKPKKNFQLNAAIGVRGRGQQRFGQLKSRDCDCDDGTPVWSLRTQGAYNFWSNSGRSFVQVGVQYEKILSGARLEREYPGLGLSKNWKPYGTTSITVNVGHDWHFQDKKLGGAVLRTKVGPVYDATHGLAIQASATMIFIGKRELPKREAPDAVERKVNNAAQWVANTPKRLKRQKEERDSVELNNLLRINPDFITVDSTSLALDMKYADKEPQKVMFIEFKKPLPFTERAQVTKLNDAKAQVLRLQNEQNILRVNVWQGFKTLRPVLLKNMHELQKAERKLHKLQKKHDRRQLKKMRKLSK